MYPGNPAYNPFCMGDITHTNEHFKEGRLSAEGTSFFDKFTVKGLKISLYGKPHLTPSSLEGGAP